MNNQSQIYVLPGDIKREMFSDGRVIDTYPDGTKLEKDDNDDFVLTRTDGSKVTKSGKVVTEITQDGVREIAKTSGSNYPDVDIRKNDGYTWSYRNSCIKEIRPDGSQLRVFPSETYENPEGAVFQEVNAEGKITKQYEGHPTHEIIEDRILRKYYANGILAIEEKKDGPCVAYLKNGIKSYEKLENGTRIEYDFETGLKAFEKRTDGTVLSWHYNGLLKSYEDASGCQEWYSSGAKLREKDVSGKDVWYYENGQKQIEYVPGEHYTRFNQYGKVVGKYVNIKSADYSDAQDTVWFSDGTEIHSEYMTNGRLTSRYKRTKEEMIYYNSSGEIVGHLSYNEKGEPVDDTDKILTLKRIAEKRIAKEERIAKKEGKDNVVLPKMNKLEKAIEVTKHRLRDKLRD